jgi:hypothetical protein
MATENEKRIEIYLELLKEKAQSIVQREPNKSPLEVIKEALHIIEGEMSGY